MIELSTADRILAEGKKEFLQKGYKDASLRNIVKQAGVTTGAFYGYYTDKEALFKALVSPFAENMKKMFLNSLEIFDNLPESRQIKEMHTFTGREMDRLVDYIFDNFDACKLITCCSSGTEYEHYIDELVEYEVESTCRFIQVLNNNGYSILNINMDICHMLASAYMNGIFETVAHDMGREEAKEHIAVICKFFNAGWDEIFGLP